MNNYKQCPMCKIWLDKKLKECFECGYIFEDEKI